MKLTPDELFAKMNVNTELSTEEVWEEVARRTLKIRPDRDGRICVCGHPLSYHQGGDEDTRRYLESLGREVRISCQPLRQECPCQSPRAVIMAKNSRRFIMKSVGGRRSEHALHRGVLNANAHGDQFIWLINTCDRCHQTKTEDVYGMNAEMSRFTPGPSKHNFLICPNCRIEILSQ